jgi:hypothetical protein
MAQGSDIGSGGTFNAAVTAPATPTPATPDSPDPMELAGTSGISTGASIVDQNKKQKPTVVMGR